MRILIDIVKDKGNVEIDYLFKLKKKYKLIRIQHEQEVYKYKSVSRLRFMYSIRGVS